MKKALSILLLCGLLLAQTALAEGLPPGAQYIELDRTLTIDDINWPDDMEPLTYRVNTWLYGFLPLPDGAKVLSGYMQYLDEYRNPYMASYVQPEAMLRNEAYAFCVEPDGSVRWELRLADPQAENSFWTPGLLPDGRILMRFMVHDTTFGPKYFIIGQDGFVESMLDHRVLSDAFTPMSLMLTPGGYLGGDSTVVDDHYDRHYDRQTISMDEYDRHVTLLGFDLNPIWTLDMEEYTGAAMNPDALGLREGTLLFDSCSHPEKPEDREAYQAFALQVNPEGGVDWRYTGGQTDRARIVSAVETAEGVLLVESSYDAEGVSQSRLIAMTAEGKERFTVDLSGQEALAAVDYFGEIVPLGDGFVLSGQTETRGETLLAHLDAQGTLLGTLLLAPDADGTIYAHYLKAGADGKTYLYGMVREAGSEERWWDSDAKGFYYTELVPESFE